MTPEELAESVELIRKTLMPESAALATINALVELVGEINFRLITAQAVAVNIGAELVRLDDMPSSFPEDYSIRLPRWILRKIGKANDFQRGRGNRLKKGCVDEIRVCTNKSGTFLAQLAKDE